jgi:multidrug efflux pump subunit AcrA (membrane-fusion protein)
LKARFANADESLWPGESYTVRVILKVDSQAVTVPEQSLQQGQQGPFVYVIKDGKPRSNCCRLSMFLMARRSSPRASAAAKR